MSFISKNLIHNIKLLSQILVSKLKSLQIRYVVVKVHGSWAEFREYYRQQVPVISPNLSSKTIFTPSFQIALLFNSLLSLNLSLQEGAKRLLAFTKRGVKTHSVSSQPHLFCTPIPDSYLHSHIHKKELIPRLTFTGLYLPKRRLSSVWL